MEITKEQKIAVLKSIQNDLLSQFRFAKSVETKASCQERLKIEASKTNLQKLHADVDMLLKFYANVAR